MSLIRPLNPPILGLAHLLGLTHLRGLAHRDPPLRLAHPLGLAHLRGLAHQVGLAHRDPPLGLAHGGHRGALLLGLALARQCFDVPIGPRIRVKLRSSHLTLCDTLVQVCHTAPERAQGIVQGACPEPGRRHR